MEMSFSCYLSENFITVAQMVKRLSDGSAAFFSCVFMDGRSVAPLVQIKMGLLSRE